MLGAAGATATVKRGPEDMPAGKSVFRVWLFEAGVGEGGGKTSRFLLVSDATGGGDSGSER